MPSERTAAIQEQINDTAARLRRLRATVAATGPRDAETLAQYPEIRGLRLIELRLETLYAEKRASLSAERGQPQEMVWPDISRDDWLADLDRVRERVLANRERMARRQKRGTGFIRANSAAAERFGALLFAGKKEKNTSAE